MIKRIILLLIFLCYCPAVLAGFWSAIGECVTDPCNCGDGSSTKYEVWDGGTYNRGKKNYLCPPWNKNGSRHDNTCLVRNKDVDGGGAPGFLALVFYIMKICALKQRLKVVILLLKLGLEGSNVMQSRVGQLIIL